MKICFHKNIITRFENFPPGPDPFFRVAMEARGCCGGCFACLCFVCCVCEPTTDVMRATPSYWTSRVMTCVVPCRRPPKTRKTDSQPHHRSCQTWDPARWHEDRCRHFGSMSNKQLSKAFELRRRTNGALLGHQQTNLCSVSCVCVCVLASRCQAIDGTGCD